MENKSEAQREFMEFLNKPLNLVIDENMKPAKPTGAIARKIEEANEHLSKIKDLDEILKRYSSPE